MTLGGGEPGAEGETHYEHDGNASEATFIGKAGWHELLQKWHFVDKSYSNSP